MLKEFKGIVTCQCGEAKSEYKFNYIEGQSTEQDRQNLEEQIKGELTDICPRCPKENPKPEFVKLVDR